MEREAEWVSEKASTDAEENGGAVDVTKTKQNGSRQAGMEQPSVYFVGDEGVWKCRHCIWTYQFCGPPVDHIQKHEGYCHVAMDTETLTWHGTYSTSLVKGSLPTDGASGMKIREANHSINGKNKIQVNGKTEFKTKESDDLENALVSEEISDHISTEVLLENGSSSNLPNGCNAIGVGRSELEIEEDTRVELVKKTKQQVAEIDLEKVLEEQETHDLYCPNCHSCITKRVILRKRKRTLRETQYDTPPAKVQQLPLLGATTASADEITELGQDTEPDVFRCLSCFSFFIPTDTGFNIFRIFGRRETENQLISQLLPAKTEITSSPIFKPVGIKSGESESGLRMASDNTTDFVRHMGETSTNIQIYPDTTASEAIKFRESRVTIERNDAETGFNIFRIFGRRGTQTQQTSQLSPAKIVSSHVFKPVGMISGASESGLRMLSDSTITSVQHMGETPTNIKTYPATTTLGDFRIGRSQTTTEMSHEGLSMPSDSTIVSVQHMGATSTGIQTYPETTTVSVQHMGETSTGIQTYPDTTTTVSVQHMGETSTGIQTYPDTTTVSVQHMGETSTSIQSYPDTTTTVSVQHMGETSMGIQTYPDTTTTVSVQHMGETSTSIQTYPATTTLGDFRIGLNQITTEMSGAVVGVQFDVESNNNSGKDPSFKEKQSPLTISVLGDSGARNTEEGQSTNAEKAADGMNWVSFTSDGKQVADPAESSMQIYLDKTESEAPIPGNIQVMTGGGMSGPISIVTSSESTSLISQNIYATVPPASMVSTHVETQIYLGERSAGDRTGQNWDVLKSIVYGGLIESLTSLSIVSSAAGGDASTLNIVALGLANLIGGLFVIAHDLSELRAAQDDAIDKNGEPADRYWELLGRKANFRLHATVAVLAYLLAGLIPPLIYGFSFRKSDNKEYKLLVVAAASFVCISLLAIGKAHVYARKAYIKSLAYYLSLSFAASGLSYVAGVMIHRFLVQLGLYDSNAVAPVPPSHDIYHGVASTLDAWASS